MILSSIRFKRIILAAVLLIDYRGATVEQRGRLVYFCIPGWEIDAAHTLHQERSGGSGGKWLPVGIAYRLDIDIKEEKRMIPSLVFIENQKDSCHKLRWGKLQEDIQEGRWEIQFGHTNLETMCRGLEIGLNLESVWSWRCVFWNCQNIGNILNHECKWNHQGNIYRYKKKQSKNWTLRCSKIKITRRKWGTHKGIWEEAANELGVLCLERKWNKAYREVESGQLCKMLPLSPVRRCLRSSHCSF